MESERKRVRLLAMALALLLVTIWLQPGSHPLIEHDETRYAEIAREMLASRNYLVPHLNGVVWYEKPPLLFWADAASMRLFGVTSWSARFPTRLAGLGTLVLVYVFVRRESDRLRAILAALVAAGSPLGWGIAHINITDGLLTFFLTAAIMAAHAATRESSARTRTILSVIAGIACGLAFLTKGLIGFVFPAAIVGLWALSAGRLAQYINVAPTAIAAAGAVVTPWLTVVSMKCPEYLEVLLIREHFARYTTTVHQRQEPIFFSVFILALALVPLLGSFVSSLVRRPPSFTESERLLIIWFTFVVLFFSFSKSQLASYVAPAVPAASAFIALRFANRKLHTGVWALQAVVATLLVAASLIARPDSAPLLDTQLRYSLAIGALLLLMAVWTAFVVAKRDEWAAAALTFGGFGALYASLVFAWPHSASSREMRELLATIERGRGAYNAELVMYRTFPRGLPWLLKSPVPFCGVEGELSDGARALTDPEHSIAWSEARFWNRWKQGSALMAVVRTSEIAKFEQRAGNVPNIIGRANKILLVANFPLVPRWTGDLKTSTTLFASGLDPHKRPVPIASVPRDVLSAAKAALRGEVVVRAFFEQTHTGYAWELVTSGSVPRVIEVDTLGRMAYTEELIEKERIPAGVVAELRRLEPNADILFARLEDRVDGELDRYEICVSDNHVMREIEIDAAGKLLD